MNNLDGNKGMERGVNEVTYISRLENKVKNLELQLKEKFEEEFEGSLSNFGQHEGGIYFCNGTKTNLEDLLLKYLEVKDESYPHDKNYKSPEVKISAKKGKIIIERIEE